MAPVSATASPGRQGLPSVGLYTADELRRRDASGWTLVQGILAPVQFLVFLVSLALVLRALLIGTGESAALGSVVIKTAVLYLIMITGALWERDVFGQYLFARPFFWEDVVSMLVLALHTLYLWAWGFAAWPTGKLLVVALLAYGAYLINAAQFVIKFRSARRQRAGVAG